MKRKTYWMVTCRVNGETIQRDFERKIKALNFLSRFLSVIGEKDWMISQNIYLRIGVRGLNRCSWKKRKTTFIFADRKEPMRTIKGSRP